MKIERIAIVGMGALGILYGGFLSDQMGKDHVGFVADPDRRRRYEAAQITSNGQVCDFRMIPSEQPAEPADLVIFAVKATGLERAMEDAAGQIDDHTILLSLLNGISSEEQLAARFGGQNLVYCVAQGMDAVKQDFSLTYTAMGQLCVGAVRSEQVPALNAVCALFDRTGLPYTREADILHRQWSKLMLNVGINQVAMVFEGGYGIVHNPGKPREMMIAAMREVMALARCEGVTVTEDDLNYYVELVGKMSPEGMPSMRQDGLNHRRSEVELFSGTVRRLAKKHGLKVPVNDWLYQKVQEMESKY